MSAKKDEIICEKKLKRLENKKRKIKAFLEIAKSNDLDRIERFKLKHAQKEPSSADSETSTDEMADLPKKRPKLDLTVVEEKDNSHDSPAKNEAETSKSQAKRVQLPADELRRLRAEVIARKKFKSQLPVFYLLDNGLKAQFQVDRSMDESQPLFMLDIQHLLLCAVIEGRSPYRPKWCRLIRAGKISHTVLVIVEGLSAEDFSKNADSLPRVQSIFQTMVAVVPPAIYGGCIAQELLWVMLSKSAKGKIVASTNGSIREAINNEVVLPYRSLINVFKIKSWMESNSKEQKSRKPELPSGDLFPRTELLLGPIRMYLEGYPLINKVRGFHDFIYTKDEYECVTPRSPLFAVDCEMCFTTARTNELTRVSIVNEKMEVVYDTLVKPYNQIINYLTKYSGITEEMLRDVKTRIEDVQRRIQEILPPDAILCGQSLNGDLKALKMIHPYIIDTSVIYNLSGLREKKTGLKKLMKMFLDETIQDHGAEGHDSIEDSISAMKLVLLKLNKGINFGDVLMEDCQSKEDSVTENSMPASKHPVFSSKTGLVTSLLKLVVQNGKKVAVVRGNDRADCYELATTNLENNNLLKTINVSTNKQVSLHAQQQAINHDLTIVHMKLGPEHGESKLMKLDKRLKRIYKSCAPNSFVMIVFGDAPFKDGDCKDFDNGLCMIQLKGPQ